MSLTRLVAHMGWAHVKGPKGIDPYPLNHTPLIFPICYMGLCHA